MMTLCDKCVSIVYYVKWADCECEMCAQFIGNETYYLNLISVVIWSVRFIVIHEP